MPTRFHSTARPLKLAHFSTSQEIVLGWLTQVTVPRPPVPVLWLTQAFELYAVFSPLQSKLSVITAVS